jgi:hypothetical protein
VLQQLLVLHFGIWSYESDVPNVVRKFFYLFSIFFMTTFKVFSAECPSCDETVSTLKDAIAQNGCGCEVETVSCDGACDSSAQHGFNHDELPVVLKDDQVVYRGSRTAITREQVLSFLPTA